MAFDIDKYTANSAAVGWGDLDFDEFDRNPLPASTLRTLRYMCDVEYHTVCYLRDLLTTPSHKEPEIGAFMTMWNREEFWHGEALAAVLNKHGIRMDFDELKATRIKLGWKDRLDPIKQSMLGGLVGHDFVAVHMAWGAANEWSANAAYLRLAKQEGHPVLADQVSAGTLPALADRSAPQLAHAHARGDLDQLDRVLRMILATTVEHVLDRGAAGQQRDRQRSGGDQAEGTSGCQRHQVLSSVCGGVPPASISFRVSRRCCGSPTSTSASAFR